MLALTPRPNPDAAHWPPQTPPGLTSLVATTPTTPNETKRAWPQGDVHKRKEIVQDVTLHDLDSANARPQGGQVRATMVGGHVQLFVCVCVRMCVRCVYCAWGDC